VAVVLSGFKIGKCTRVAVVKLDGSCKEHYWISVCTPGLYPRRVLFSLHTVADILVI